MGIRDNECHILLCSWQAGSQSYLYRYAHELRGSGCGFDCYSGCDYGFCSDRYDAVGIMSGQVIVNRAEVDAQVNGRRRNVGSVSAYATCSGLEMAIEKPLSDRGCYVYAYVYYRVLSRIEVEG